MKTRIISAAVGIVIFAFVLFFSIKNALVLLCALALLNVVGTYEMLCNTKILKNKLMLYIAMAFSAVFPFFAVLSDNIDVTLCVYAIYVLIAATLSVTCHATLDTAAIFASLSAPLLLSMGFGSIYLLFSAKGMAHFYFVLIFLFSWGADTAAYFGGTFFGKHKLAPVVSPKKTYEGSFCGILGSVLLTVIVGFIYSANSVKIDWVFVLVAAVVFAVIGMVGDLFTSQIKRDRGIKDYGNIMPGHGGVLDRFDSVLLISPLFCLFLKIFELI